jgi:putative oxidoreductase
MRGIDIGLLVLRLGFAALLFGHATQKLFGWFRGGGPAGSGKLFETWGFRPGAQLAVVAGTCELLGAGSIALGLLTPGGCAILIGTMLVAASPAARNGLWAHLGGNEVPVVYAFLATVIAVTGPGRFSLDRAFGLSSFGHLWWAVIAIAVGAIAAVPMLMRRGAALRADAASGTGSVSRSASETGAVDNNGSLHDKEVTT